MGCKMLRDCQFCKDCQTWSMLSNSSLYWALKECKCHRRLPPMEHRNISTVANSPITFFTDDWPRRFEHICLKCHRWGWELPFQEWVEWHVGGPENGEGENEFGFPKRPFWWWPVARLHWCKKGEWGINTC